MSAPCISARRSGTGRRDGSLRLAYVAPRYEPFIGGVETHVRHLARLAAARGHRVEVLTQEPDRRLPPVEALGGVTVRRFPMIVPAANYALAPGLWAYLARHAAAYDVIHAHSYHALPALAAALTNRTPLVFTPHYHGTGHSAVRSLLHLPYRPFGAAIFARAAAIICVSEAEAALVRRHFWRAADRVRVIPNGVQIQAMRAARPFPADGPMILSVGRLERSKRVERTIRALAHLEARVTLRVAGVGPAREELEQLAAGLGLAERVALMRRVSDEDLRRWYRTAAVYVTNSTHEAFGITAVEALVAGARVVASDIPAHREVLGRYGAGRATLLPVDADPARLAGAIAAHLADTSTAGAPVEAPSWDEVVRDTLMVYGAVAAIGVRSAA